MSIRDTNSKRTPRKLVKLRINLNVLKPEERLIDGITKSWKAHRQQAVNIRRAILLFADLQNGGVDRLLAEFPHVADALCGGRAVVPVAPEPPRERVALEATAAKSSAAEVAGNFLSSLGGLFD